MSEDKTITMEIVTFIKYKNECYEVGEVIKQLLNKLDEKNEEIEKLHSIIKEVKEYIGENEKEYGSLEDNEKIILKILDKDSDTKE